MLASRIGFVTIAAILLGFALSVFTITPADAASCPTFTRTLSRGSSGTDVRALQTFFTEQYQNFTQDYVTGYFGPTTEAAVKQWQTSHSLVSSGTPSTTGYGAVGPRTRNAITQSCGGTVVTPTPTPTPTTTSTITRNLSRGSTGSDVIILQRILIAEGLLSNDSATGFFGALTEAAVQRFQAQNGIVSTGSPNTTGYGAVGPRTRTFITPLGIVGGGGSTGGWTPPPPPTGGDGGVWNTTPTSCTFNGATVAHGASVTAYQTSSVPTGQTCTSQTRACTDGILSKTYQYDSCTVSAAPPAPICSLTASPSSITAGQSSTLTWSTTNASSASINQSVGTVTTSGSRAVSPSATTQYTLTATGAGGTATCAETVTVAPLIQVAQWESGTTLAVSGLDGIACTIGNARTENGQEAGLAQATDNYSTLEGVGVTACLDVDFGSTQYREAKIGYRMLQSICGDSCSGSFCSTYPSLHVFTSVDRSIWNRHTSLPSSLTQTSSTASSATPFRYVRVCRNGFGASRANIAVDYVLAKKGTGPSDPLAPTCTFSASPASIPSGQSTTLAWTTANASAVSINQGVGTVSAAGSRTLTPTANITYTLTATGSGTKTCTASVAVATPTSSCTFNGATVAHGASVPAYQTASVPVGSTCTSQSRVCTNGTLSGTYTFSTCTVGTDTTPPTVSLGAAPAGTISGTVTLSATASDNVAVAGVQFKVDGANVGAEDTTGPSYSASWNTTSVANGSHSITAVARDAAGNINTTAPRTVTVSNTQLGSLPAVVTTCPQLLLWINRPETPCELNFNGYTQVDNPNGFRQKDPRVALVDASGQNAHYTDGLMFNGAIQNVSSGDNLTIQAAAGDQIVLSDDVLWKGKTIKISGNGTMQHPILVRPEHPGKVILTGDSSLWLTGSHIIVNDLKFYGPNATASDKPAGVEAVSPSTSHLIVVRLGTGTVLNPNNCDWCILNKVVIDGYNTAQSLWDNQDITYITHPTGRNNTIANSTLRHKKNLGHFLTTGQDNGNNESTHVLNNLFFDGPDLENIIATPINESKGAFVQIGNASGYRAYDIFEGNTFQNSMVNGGNFAIKESDIIIRNNIFKNTPNSPFIIRTANRVLVDSNIFDGQGAISNTGRGMGGITMSGRGHWIIRNTFQNLPSQFKNLRPIVIDDGMYESLTGPVSVVSGCPTHVPPGLDHNCYYARSQNVVIADNTFTNVDWSHFAPIYMGIFRAPNSLDLDRHPVSSTLLPRNIWILHNTFTFPTGKTLADAVYFEPPHPPDAYDGNNIVIASVAQNSNLASASSPGLVERFLTWLTNLFAGI